MFLKPFRVKKQTTVKGSDRKKLRADIEEQYPRLTGAAIADLIPNKGDVTEVKIESHSGEHFLVYCCQKIPLFFESFKKLYPTVYTLWKFPDMLPVFTTYPPVFQKLLKGADLMLPGVEVKGEHHPKMFGNLQKGDLCIVNLKGNKAPVLLGEALMSGEDMYMSAMKGKGVHTIHILHDTLWEMGDKSVPPQIPDSDPDNDISDDDNDDGDAEEDEQITNSEEKAVSAQDEEGVSQSIEQLSVEVKSAEGTVGCGEQEEDGGGVPVEVDEGEEEVREAKAVGGETVQICGPENMDQCLKQCFKWAIKGRVSKNDLPLLASNLLKTYMQPFCPPGMHLDVKKSSYKKFSKFLQQMESEDFIKVKEISKGVDAIIEIDKSHMELRGLKIPEITTAAEDNEAEGTEVRFEPPEIKEVLCVTAAVLPLLSLKGYKKGAALSGQELRQLVTEYIRTENLQNADNKELVVLNPVLAQLVLSKNEGGMTHLTWNALISRICDKMQPGCLIQQAGLDPVLRKGKMPLITFKVVKRGGSKKVTYVQNVENYGIDARQLAQHIQRKIACSATPVASEQQGSGMAVQVQGDQTAFVVRLLVETYQIPRKYIEGGGNIKTSKST